MVQRGFALKVDIARFGATRLLFVVRSVFGPLHLDVIHIYYIYSYTQPCFIWFLCTCQPPRFRSGPGEGDQIPAANDHPAHPHRAGTTSRQLRDMLICVAIIIYNRSKSNRIVEYDDIDSTHNVTDL